MTKRVIPFAELPKYCGIFPFGNSEETCTSQEFCDSINTETARVLAAAAPNDYVAAPILTSGGLFGEPAWVWVIFKPAVPKFQNERGEWRTRLRFNMNTQRAGGGDPVLLDEEGTKDLAMALTLGRATRLSQGPEQ